MTHLLAKIVQLISVVILASSSSALCTLYLNPSPAPSLSAEFNPITKLVHFSTNLTYMQSQDILYSYSIQFEAWTQSSSLFAPANCSNRNQVDFASVSWRNLWSRQDLVYPDSIYSDLNQSALVDYLAWPTSPKWSLSIVGDVSTPTSLTNIGVKNAAIISYTADFTIEELLNCGSISTTFDADFFYFSGQVKIILLQPITSYAQGGEGGEYSTKTYSFPFVVRTARNIDVIDTDILNPSSIYSYILQLDWEPANVISDAWYLMNLFVETRTPASTYSSGAVANYNILSLVSTTLESSTGNLPLTLDVTKSQLDCSIQIGSICVQKFWFSSTPVFNTSLNYNETYTLNTLLNSCLIGSSVCNQDVASLYVPQLLSSSYLSFDIFLEGKISVDALDSFSSNITYYFNTSFDEIKESTNYFLGEDIVFKHRAFLSPTFGDNFFSLFIENVYVCSPVGGVAPFIGFDSVFQMWRNGCKTSEYINGQLNIDSSSIYTIAINESTSVIDYGFEYFKLDNMLKSESGAKFSLTNIFLDSFYLHVESSLFPSSRTLSSSFSTQEVASGYKPIYTLGKLDKLAIVSGTVVDSLVVVSTTTLSTGAIVGISAGSFVFVVLIIVLFAWKSGIFASKEEIIALAAAKSKTITASTFSTKNAPPPAKKPRASIEMASIEEMKSLQTTLPKVFTPSLVKTTVSKTIALKDINFVV
jgi:hypothetical protein